ncbi:hypothetical protein ACOSQ3_027570 [Xanthoceras sorbifolium]
MVNFCKQMVNRWNRMDELITTQPSASTNEIFRIGIGFALMIASVYSAEIMSSKSQGFLTFLPELCISIGILLGYISNYFFGKLTLRLGWRLMCRKCEVIFKPKQNKAQMVGLVLAINLVDDLI